VNFELSELHKRADRLRAEAKARGLDAILLDDGEATAYFADFEISLSYYRAGVFPTVGEPFFVLRSLDVAPLKEKTWIKDVVGYPDWQNPAEVVAEKIRSSGLERSRIGIDLASHALTVQMFQALKRELPNVEFVDIDNLPWKMRKVKSPAEIEKIRKACAIGDRAMAEIIGVAKPGITEREAASMAVEAYVRLGGDPGNLGVVTAGKGWDFLHGHVHDVPLGDGDVLHLELIPRYQGYACRMMRNVVLGKIPAAMQDTADKMIALQDQQIAAMKPGAKAKDVDHILRAGSIKAGLRDSYDNITGYTLGYYSDFMVRASDFTWVFLPNSEWVLEEGMVFHMYTSAAGLAISETVLVGPNGGERLTRTERKLYSTEG
jgi:Xaa-Pro aminopeptidase